MAVSLHQAGARHARALVKAGKAVIDERDAWSEHQPSAAQENEFIRLHGMAEYGRWHFGVDDEMGPDTKGHYKYPYGDFERVHRCAVLAAESRAGQNKAFDIEREAARVLGMFEALASR
jgi:hypothetical protein